MQKSLVSFSPTFRSLIFHPNLIRTILFSTSTSSSSADFLPSYLVTKCGFSPAKADKAAESIPRRVGSPDQPDSVIAFFKSYGFNDSHLKRILSMYPQTLGLSVEKTLVPRFRTFHELGFPGNDLITLVCSNPKILHRNMDNQVVPKIKWWRGLLGSHSLLMKCLTHSRWQITTHNHQKIIRNTSLLQEYGLSDQQISTIVSRQPHIITQKPDLLKRLLSRVERLGLPPGSPNFHGAVCTVAMVTEENIRAKVELFKGFGWSEDDFRKAYCKSTFFLMPSVKNLKEKMEFFVKEARCTAAYVQLYPVLLTYSLKRRLIPRFKVLKALKERGLRGDDRKLSSPMSLTNKMFFARYVDPYKEVIPELGCLFSTSSSQ